MIGRFAPRRDRVAMARVIAECCLRHHPGPQFIIDEPLVDSDPARLFIFTDRQDLLSARIGEAGVTIQAGRSHADVPYQCDSHPADVAAGLLGTVMKGTSRWTA